MTVQDETQVNPTLPASVAAVSTSPNPLAQLMELATKLQEQSSTNTSATTLTTPPETVTAVTTIPSPKKGMTTSEGILTLAADVAATALLLTHRITSTEWAAMTGGVTAVYATARTWLKG